MTLDGLGPSARLMGSRRLWILCVLHAASTRAIIAYRTGKRDTDNTMEFIHDLRERVIGSPEISTDGFHPYKLAIRNAFGNRIAHGIITKTYSVTHLAVKDAARRYSPAHMRAMLQPCAIGFPITRSA